MLNGPLVVHRLGVVEYADGLTLQRQLIDSRKAGTAPDSLLLLEHPPVLTLGRGARATNIVAPPEELERHGVEVFDTDRGGDVTYHGPGQIVGYPLLHLGPGRQDVRRYVRSLEEVIIRTVRDFGIHATRISRWPGVWVEGPGRPRKIAALGVHLSRWYTRHGFALNVSPRLAHFGLIVPCGISEGDVTSIAAETGAAPSLPEVEERIIFHFGQVFEASPTPAAPPIPTVSVTLRHRRRLLLLRRAADRGGFWQPVTGRVEPDESPAAAARRELVEETGLDLPVTPLGYQHGFAWGEASPPRIAVEHAFVTDLAVERPVRLSAEHDDQAWLDLSEALPRLPFAGFRRAARLAVSAPEPARG